VQRVQRRVSLVLVERDERLGQREEPVEAVRLEENLVRFGSLEGQVAEGFGVEEVAADWEVVVAHVLHNVVRHVLEDGEVRDDSFFEGRFDRGSA